MVEITNDFLSVGIAKEPGRGALNQNMSFTVLRKLSYINKKLSKQIILPVFHSASATDCQRFRCREKYVKRAK
jgi:hypothetical protein